MNIPFVKMHSDGNDFVIINSTELNIDFTVSDIKNIGNRNTGIGFDQLIILEKSDSFDTFMRIYNQDGKQAEMCGNAARCVASLLFSSKNKGTITIETVSSNLKAISEKDGEVTVFMKLPEQHKKYFHLNKKVAINNVSFPSINKYLTGGMLVNMGNPHIVFIVPSLDNIDLEKYGQQIEKNSLFKKDINVEIVQIRDKNEIEIKFWERGVGLTKSCGSGIMSAFYTCFKKKLCNSSVEVILPISRVKTSIKNTDISVKGKAVVSFLGQYNYG